MVPYIILGAIVFGLGFVTAYRMQELEMKLAKLEKLVDMLLRSPK
jgi:hypothetical protein